MNSSQGERNINQNTGDSRYDSGLKALVRSLQFTFFLLILLILGMLIYFFTFGGYFTVKPQEAVIVLRFGKYVNTYTKDWHWFFPYPVNSFIHIPTNQQYLNVNFKALDIPGPPEMQAAGRPLKPGRDHYLLTGDFNIIHSSWQMEYKISEPKLYYESCLTPVDPLQDDPMLKTPEGEVMGARGPQTLLRSVLRSCVIKVNAQSSVDDMLYNTKTSSEAVESLFSKTIANLNVGITIINLQLIKAAPPTTTSKAFSQVTEAKQTSSSIIDKAENYSVKTKSAAKSKRTEILAEADTFKKIVVAEAKSESIYFDMINKQYNASPDTVLVALYNSVLGEVLSKVDDKYIFARSRGKQEIRLKINPEPLKPQFKQPKDQPAEQ
jgi:modulator of FtsH protease HflK